MKLLKVLGAVALGLVWVAVGLVEFFPVPERTPEPIALVIRVGLAGMLTLFFVVAPVGWLVERLYDAWKRRPTAAQREAAETALRMETARWEAERAEREREAKARRARQARRKAKQKAPTQVVDPVETLEALKALVEAAEVEAGEKKFADKRVKSITNVGADALSAEVDDLLEALKASVEATKKRALPEEEGPVAP